MGSNDSKRARQKTTLTWNTETAAADEEVDLLCLPLLFKPQEEEEEEESKQVDGARQQGSTEREEIDFIRISVTMVLLVVPNQAENNLLIAPKSLILLCSYPSARGPARTATAAGAAPSPAVSGLVGKSFSACSWKRLLPVQTLNDSEFLGTGAGRRSFP